MATTHPGSRPSARWRVALWGGAAGLLLLPALAMQFSDEVHWGPLDFVFAAALLGTVCGGFEWAARASASASYRAGAGLALLTALALVWINLAVGIIDGEDTPANLMYGGVVGVAIAGAVLARGRARGLMHATAAAALTQALVAAIVIGARWGLPAAVLSAAFVLPWLVAAGLFRRAAAGR